MTRRTLAIIGGVGAAAVIAVAGVAITHRDAPANAATIAPTQLADYSAAQNGARMQGRGGMGSEMSELMANDDFREEAAKLRDAHQKAMDAWWDKYANEPRSDDARAALETLRDEQRTAMSALLEKYGIDTSARDAARQAADDARDQLEELIDNDAFRSDVNALRDKHEAAMDAWWDKYADAPRSEAAVAALEKLRSAAQDDVEALLKKYDVELPAGAHGLLGLLGGEMMGRGGFGNRGGMGDCAPGAGAGAPTTATSPASTQSF